MRLSYGAENFVDFMRMMVVCYVHRKDLIMMPSTRVSVNIDEDVKQGAQRVLSEIGMDLTTAIDSFLRTIVREERIPFALRTAKAYHGAAHREYISAALDESMLEAADPNIKKLSHDEAMAHLRQRREARQRV
jgi:DNA-damage-inducible protein J